MVQKNSLNNFLVVICGPTGSGKTAIAIKLANLLNGEIISADSIAIYKELNIGTAKPTKEERRLAVHHMIDIVDPKDEFSVAEYSNMARLLIDDLIKRGKTPIICGGTGYYINAVLYDFSYGNCEKNQSFRDQCQRIIDEYGVKPLYEKLMEVDPVTANVLHENDAMRIVRALEIYQTTGVKKSSIVDEKTPYLPFFAFSFDYEREVLYDRINKRVDKMFEAGLLDEVNNLLKKGVDENCQSMQGIGYKEVVQAIKENMSVEETKELIKRNTRRYAKRQITWFKRLDNLTYLKPDQNIDSQALYIKDLINGKVTL